jgi:hypothetical protein
VNWEKRLREFAEGKPMTLDPKAIADYIAQLKKYIKDLEEKNERLGKLKSWRKEDEPSNS